jgi:ABC transporter substrate-binding protein PnrA-like
MKRMMIGGLVAALALGAGTLAAPAQEKLKVGFVYLGPIGDFGWTYQHEAGRQALVKHFGDKIETTYLENVNEGPDAERAIEQLARTGHKLIFTTSFGYMEPTVKVAKKYPAIFFEHNTGYKRDKNLATYSARFYEGRYIQGQIAAKMSKSGVLGYVGSFPIPEVISGMNSTMLGAQSINPNIKVKIIWVNTWFDPGKEADAAKALIDQGADVLMPAHRQPGRHAGRRVARQICLRPGLRHGQVRAQGAAHRDRQQLGALLHRSRSAGARQQMDLGRHLGRAQVDHAADGRLHQHARRREEGGGSDPGRDHRRHLASVQMPGRRPGRKHGRVQGRHPPRRRADPRHELLRQRHRREDAGEVTA